VASSERAGVTRPYRVVQWGAGNTGGKALRFILTDPSLELVGLYVSRQLNRGRDAGELVGLEPAGIDATSSVDAIIALDADCVVYMAAEPNGSAADTGSDGWKSVETICELLASGKNVVSTGISGLANPRFFGEGVADRLTDAAMKGGSTFFGTGIEPGFMCDLLALTLTGVTRNVRSIRAQEMISYATYDQPNHHVSNGGMWGAPCDQSFAELFAAGVLDGGMSGPVRLLADALAIELDDVVARVEFAAAPEAFDLPIGPISKGSVAGYRFEVLGMVDGEPMIALEHITRVHHRAAPDWPNLQPGGFRIMLEGTPSYRVDVIVDEPDANVGACTGTAARAVNAIPVVCAAPAGVCSFLDLPLIPASPRVPSVRP
jgi:4-hydroxy-tetrahydrodipicolinate reductase